MSDLSIALIGGTVGAVVGAIVGGAATLFASLIVERRRLAHEMRIRMYDELLPPLRETFFGLAVLRADRPLTSANLVLPPEFYAGTASLERAGVIVGGKEARLAMEIEGYATRWRNVVDLGGWTAHHEWCGDREQISEIDMELSNRLGKLYYYLARKLR